MSAENETCDKCGLFAGFEAAPSGQICDVCDLWCCDDCIDWSIDRRHDKRMGQHDNVCTKCYSN